jgi:hypothetical protein
MPNENGAGGLNGRWACFKPARLMLDVAFPSPSPTSIPPIAPPVSIVLHISHINNSAIRTLQ